ncbi:MAG: CDP-alcohol phosphatidyltransferase family protein [Kofleriaceae bacterium]
MATAAAGAAPRVVSPFNPANAVTASRFLTLPPFVWAVDNGYPKWATLFMLICGILDKLDGAVAKLFDCRSAFGEVFDAIADGLCYGFAMILIAAYGWAPVIPVVVTVGLGALNSGLRLVYAKRAGRTVNYKSYAMERAVGFIAFLIGFATSGMETKFYYWAFVPFMVAIVAHDAKRMLIDPIPDPISAPVPAEVAS